MNIYTQVFFDSCKTNKEAIDVFKDRVTGNKAKFSLGNACFASWNLKIINSATPVYYGLIIREIDLEPLKALLKIYDSHMLRIVYSNPLPIKKKEGDWGDTFTLATKVSKSHSSPKNQNGLAVLIKIVTNKELTAGSRNVTRYMLMVTIRMFCYYEKFVTSHLSGKYGDKLVMKTAKLSKLKAHKFYPLEHIVEITKSEHSHEGHKLMDRTCYPPGKGQLTNANKELTTKILLLFNNIEFINSMNFDTIKPRQTHVLLSMIAKLKE